MASSHSEAEKVGRREGGGAWGGTGKLDQLRRNQGGPIKITTKGRDKCANIKEQPRRRGRKRKRGMRRKITKIQVLHGDTEPIRRRIAGLDNRNSVEPRDKSGSEKESATGVGRGDIHRKK